MFQPHVIPAAFSTSLNYVGQDFVKDSRASMPHHHIFAGDFFADWVRRRLSPAFMSAVRRAGMEYDDVPTILFHTATALLSLVCAAAGQYLSGHGFTTCY